MTYRIFIPSLVLMSVLTVLPPRVGTARDYTPDTSSFFNVCNGVGDCTPGVNTAGFSDYITQMSPGSRTTSRR